MLTNNCCADTEGGWLNVNLYADPLNVALPPPVADDELSVLIIMSLMGWVF